MDSMPGIVDVERHYPAPVSEAFAAWSSAEAMLEWSGMPEGWSMQCDNFSLSVGHEDLWRFGPDGETPYENRNRYVAVEAERRIAYTTTLSQAGHLSFAGAVCVTFDGDSSACRLRLVEAGIHLGGDDRAGHAEGWNAMLDALGAWLARRTDDRRGE